MLDADTVNETNTIEHRIRQEENKIKNQILAMHDSQKKQAEWKKHFAPVQRMSDDWIITATVW